MSFLTPPPGTSKHLRGCFLPVASAWLGLATEGSLGLLGMYRALTDGRMVAKRGTTRWKLPHIHCSTTGFGL